MNLSIALAQAEFKLGDPESNFEKASKLITKAAENGAGLILLPELWVSGYDLANFKDYASPINEGWFSRVGSAAKNNKIALGCSMIEEDGGSYYNTFVFYDSSGSLLGKYRKIHLFEKLKEKDYFQPGIDLINFDFDSVKIGLATCYDLRFPELFSAHAAAGVELILITAEWPKKRVNHWSLLIKARAIENQYFVAAVNKVGESFGAQLGGHSVVVDPMGEILVEGEDNEVLLLTDINLNDGDRVRRWMPVLKDRKPDLYQKFHKASKNDCIEQNND